jgi:phosphoserine phosphatase
MVNKMKKKEKCNYYCYNKKNKFKNNNNNNNKKIKNNITIKLVIFDMDGVLTDTLSSWKYIHDYFGSSNERSVDEYLKGNIDDLEFIRRDVSLWKENGKPINKDKLENILSSIPYMKGSKECISTLKNNNIKTSIISAGLDILAKRVAKKLKIDYVYANGLKIDKNGYLNGEGILGVELIRKDKNVIDLSKKLNIPLENFAAVGNSCFDIPMLKNCGLGIAFNPEDECIKKAADIIIEEKDLSKLINYIDQYI